MKIEKFTLNSLYDSLPLSCCAYLPEGEPKGIFQIVHGMCEYKEDVYKRQAAGYKTEVNAFLDKMIAVSPVSAAKVAEEFYYHA